MQACKARVRSLTDRKKNLNAVVEEHFYCHLEVADCPRSNIAEADCGLRIRLLGLQYPAQIWGLRSAEALDGAHSEPSPH